METQANLDEVLSKQVGSSVGIVGVGAIRKATLWYDINTGDVCRVGPRSPKVDNPDIGEIDSVRVMFDELGAKPELVRDVEVTPALKIALKQIRQYREAGNKPRVY